MDSIRVPFESNYRELVDFERIQQYLVEQDRRVIRCQRASTRRIAGLRIHTAHDLVPAADLEAMQEILEIASARVRRRLSERFNHATVHQLSRGIRNREHRRRIVQRMVQRPDPSYHRPRPVLSTDQQDHHQQGENVEHEQIGRLQGDQDYRQERVDDIVNEQMARLEGLQLQDTVRHHPVLPPVLSTHMVILFIDLAVFFHLKYLICTIKHAKLEPR